MATKKFLIQKLLESPNHPSIQVRVNNALVELVDFKEDFIAFSEGDYTSEDLDKMSPYELLDARLRYEGIIGYTSDIMKWCCQVMGLGLMEHELRDLGI